MMIALIKKELREHWVVAGLALFASLALSAAFLRAPFSPAYRYTTSLWELGNLPVPITDGGYLRWLAGICYVAAVLLGLLMTWKETLRKTWPFLLHRPVSRVQVLGSKLIAGALILLVAVGVPFGLLAVWSAVPGNFPAPWSMDYLFPGIITLICGIAFFLTSFVAGMWPRGYATRFTPLIGMGLLVLSTEIVTTRLMVAVITALALALGVAAAAAVFLAARSLRWALALLSGTGVGVALAIITGIGIAIFYDGSPHRPGNEEWHYPAFTRAGKPVLMTYGSWGSRRTVRNLDGTDLTQPVNWQQDLLAMAYLIDLRNYRHIYRRGKERFSLERLGMGHQVYSGSEIWYLQRRQGIILVYDWESNRATAYIGANGFVKTAAAAEPFVDPRFIDYHVQLAEGNRKIITRDGLFLIDATKRIVKRPLDSEIYRFGTGYDQNSERKTLRYVQTKEAVIVYDKDEAEVGRFRLPARFQGLKSLQVGLVDANTLALWGYPGDSVWPIRGKALVGKIDRTGRLIWSQEVTLPESQYKPGQEEQDTMTYGPLLPGVNPISIAAGLGLIRAELSAEQCAYTYRAVGPMAGLALGLTFLKVLICAVATFVILGRWNVDRAARIGWSLFVLLGGIPGMLTVFALLPAEKRVPCPTCGAKRLPSMPTCPKCSGAWPGPERRDTDLFATA